MNYSHSHWFACKLNCDYICTPPTEYLYIIFNDTWMTHQERIDSSSLNFAKWTQTLTHSAVDMDTTLFLLSPCEKFCFWEKIKLILPIFLSNRKFSEEKWMIFQFLLELRVLHKFLPRIALIIGIKSEYKTMNTLQWSKVFFLYFYGFDSFQIIWLKKTVRIIANIVWDGYLFTTVKELPNVNKLLIDSDIAQE